MSPVNNLLTIILACSHVLDQLSKQPAPNGQNVNLKDLLIAGAARLILSASVILCFKPYSGRVFIDTVLTQFSIHSAAVFFTLCCNSSFLVKSGLT